MTYCYQGGELDVFRRAVNWKGYYSAHLKPFITGDTLEVGAGLGGTSRFLCDGTQRSWTCLEPDPRLRDALEKSLVEHPLSVPARTLECTVADLAAGELFDTIIYIDVLEHIENDRAELETSAAHLRAGGTIIVLAPAHDWLFSPFDRAVGHYRRYSKSQLVRLTTAQLELTSAFYLDSVGLLASAANRAILRDATPTARQIWFWDSALVRLSRIVDPLTRRRVGKTVIAVWRKTPDKRPTRDQNGERLRSL
jgi:SAM-dependent methyltransferase